MKLSFKLNRALLSIVALLIASPMHAQEEVEIDYTLTFKTVKNPDFSRSMIAEFYGMADRDKYPIYQAEITFLNVLDTQEVVLGTVKTDKEGIAKLDLTKEQNYLRDEDAYMTFRAVFEETEGIDAFEEELAIIDLNLTMELNESEDGRSITAYANMINAEGEEEPIEESDIYFKVQGMLGRLTVDPGWLEYGEYTFDFPDDIPGDKDGNLEIYAMIQDNYDYGDVTQKAAAQWGTGPIVSPARTAKLWTELGPEWMIAVLTVLLIAVWANIIHTIYNLNQIKKEG